MRLAKTRIFRRSRMPRAAVPVIDTSLEGYGNAKVGERWRELSPAHNVRVGLPPTITFHGTGDTTCRSRRAGISRCDVESRQSQRARRERRRRARYLMRTQPLFDECLTKSDAFLASLSLLPGKNSCTSSSETAAPLHALGRSDGVGIARRTSAAGGTRSALLLRPLRGVGKAGRTRDGGDLHAVGSAGAKTLRGFIVHQHGCGISSAKTGLTAAYDLHCSAAKKWDCALLGPSYSFA